MAEFQGSSENGDFQEALREAIAAAVAGTASEAIYWKLVRTYGFYGGFAPENRLTVVIDATPPLLGDADARGETGAQAEVPTFAVGVVQRLEGPDFCMDGARFRLLTGGKIYRLKTSNREAEAYLERVAGSRQRVAVAGYMRHGPECSYLDVYYAGPAESAIESLGGGSAS